MGDKKFCLKPENKIFGRLLISLFCFFISVTACFASSAKYVYKKASPAVVVVTASQGTRNSYSVGSGSVIFAMDEKGSMNRFVLTNAHVVYDEDADKPMSSVNVYLKPKKLTGDFKSDMRYRAAAEIVKYDVDIDLAILKFAGTMPSASYISLADSNEVEMGEDVLAIGHPEQGGLFTLTTGVISAKRADLDGIEGKNVFQTEVSINRGNSGGPLLDMRGNLVGVNTSIARRAADGLAITGINFALTSETVKVWMKKNGYDVVLVKAGDQELSENAVGPGPNERQATITPQPGLKEVRQFKKADEKERPGSRYSTEKQEDLAVAEDEFPVADFPQKKDGSLGNPDKSGADPREGGAILTPKRPFSREELIDFLMSEKERDMDEKMKKLWDKF